MHAEVYVVGVGMHVYVRVFMIDLLSMACSVPAWNFLAVN